MATQPPLWTDVEFTDAARISKEAFRQERVEEPLELYYEKYDRFSAVVEDLLEETVDLSLLRSDPTKFITSKDRLTAIRYLASPAISADDLMTIADVSSLAISVLQKKPDDAGRIVAQVLDNIDRNRFPWVSEIRDSTEAERTAAVVSTVALAMTQEVQTERRNAAKKAQEGAVSELLRELGFTEVKRCAATILSQAPGNMEFCGEAQVGPGKADIVIGLPDGRKMLIECKVSNSTVNSYKRVNREAAGKAVEWLKEFGTAQVIPAAVISGVFSPANLVTAQSTGLHILWAHELSHLEDFIRSLMPAQP